MNCQEFWNTLPQKGGIDEEQSDHLAECAACAAQWEPHRLLAENLQALAEDWRKLEAPARVEAGLLAAFRSQANFPVRQSVLHSWWTPVLAWASAAAAMIAMAAALSRGYQPAVSTPAMATPHHSVQALTELASAASVDADSDDDASILGDGFVRLPNTPRLDPNDGFNVVRVEMPESDLIAAGVSVSDDRASATVDVALGPDGTARAVRLVSDGGTN